MSTDKIELTEGPMEDMLAPGIGHNHPEDPIMDVVREAQQARDLRDKAKIAEERAKAPWLQRAEDAGRDHHREWEGHHSRYGSLCVQIGKWQEKQRQANPFADAREQSRVIIDGEVAATVRGTEVIEIVKPDMVPREFCSPDEAKIKAELRMGREVPGVIKRTRYSVMVR